MKFLVVGAGIAGSSFARLAHADGHDVTVVASATKQPASRAALCVVKPSWFKGEYRNEAEWSIGWYRDNGWLTAEQANYRSHRHDRNETRGGYFAIDALAPLVEPTIYDEWNYESALNDEHDHVIVCRGAHSDSTWQRLYGATSIMRSNGVVATWAYNDRPRSVLFACSHDGETLRFGSSKAKTIEKALDAQRKEEHKALEANFIPQDAGRYYITGVRLVAPTLDEAGKPRAISTNMTAVEGFGRVGYSLAPARMFSLLRALTS